MGSSNLYLDPIVVPMVRGPRVLDVACGFGRWGVLLTTNAWEADTLSRARLDIVACEAFEENARLARSFNVYSEVVDTRVPPLPFEDEAFNTVLLLEIVEHLDKEAGEKLIAEAKRVASERVILSTPNYPAFRPGHETLTGFNELEAHRSYWSRRDLRSHDFKLYGAGWTAGPPLAQKVIRRLGLRRWYNSTARANLSSLSRSLPVCGDSIVALWTRR